MMVWKPVVSIALSMSLATGLLSPADTISNLQKLVNSTDNKQIYSQLLFADNAFYDLDANVAGTLDFVPYHQFQRQPYVANGYIGARIPNLGHGFAYDSTEDGSDSNDTSNGWPLFNDRYAGAFAAGFYNLQSNATGTNFPWLDQYGYDSFIASIPQWTTLSLSRGNVSLDPSEDSNSWGGITNYVQNMSLSDGTVVTQYTWMDELNVKYEVLANKKDFNTGFVRVSIHNPSNSTITLNVTDSLNINTAQRCEHIEAESDEKNNTYIAFKPSGIDDVFGAIYSSLQLGNTSTEPIWSHESNGSVKASVQISIQPHEVAEITKVVSIVTSDLDPSTLNSSSAVVERAKDILAQVDLGEFEQDHKDAWEEVLSKESMVKFTDEPLLTLAARASIFHLNANMRPGASGLTSALGVSGLSSDSYGGQVFWDTDLWMSQGILPFNPSISESLLQYRVHTREQAIKNIESPSRPKDSFEGAVYPWTSGRFGNCTATGPCFDYEYHLNAAIALSAFKLYLSGAVGDDYLEDIIYPIVEDSANLFASYVDYDSDMEQFVTTNLTDPDEFANHVSNAAYTNSAISANMDWLAAIAAHLKKDMLPIFPNISRNMHLPLSPDSESLVMEYTDMNSTIDVKQADVIMITYPLDNQLISDEEAITNIDYYAMKQVSTGPAMTFSIFSIVSSAMFDTGCACESYLVKSVQPYLRGPFGQFSEQNNDDFETNGGTHPAFPFLTAHGGFLQVLLSGILGMRYSYKVQNGTIARILKFEVANLSLLPSGISFGGVKYMNHTLSIDLEESVLTVRNEGLVPNTTDPEQDIVIHVSQKDGGLEKKTLGVKEKADFNISASRLSYVDSLTECGRSQFTNITAGVHGDVPQSMQDGQSSTHWQSSVNTTAQVLIDLKNSQKINSGFIDWGAVPPTSLKIFASSNSSESEYPQLNSTLDVLSVVDFGPSIAAKYAFYNPDGDVIQQSDFFEEKYSTDVNITEPFNATEFAEVRVSQRTNSTQFNFEEDTHCRFLLVEFSGVHGDTPEGGARIHEIRIV